MVTRGRKTRGRRGTWAFFGGLWCICHWLWDAALYSLRDVERRPVLCSFKRIEGGSAYQKKKKILRKKNPSLHPPLVRGVTAHEALYPGRRFIRRVPSRTRFHCPSVHPSAPHVTRRIDRSFDHHLGQS